MGLLLYKVSKWGVYEYCDGVFNVYIKYIKHPEGTQHCEYIGIVREVLGQYWR